MRGRPPQSQIRQNIIEILYYLKEGYGYQISKIYNKAFPKASQRVIYYHLRKGVGLEELKVKKIHTEKGDFSWGDSVEKIVYTLGERAEPKVVEKVKDAIREVIKKRF